MLTKPQSFEISVTSTGVFVSFAWRRITLHDAKVGWTYDVRENALIVLKGQRPDLYARYKLANLVSYRDAQIFASKVTGQHYCEVRSELTIGTETPVENIPGAYVLWSVHSYGERGGYDTSCKIVRPENWQDDVEAKKWIDFVEENIDGVERLKAEDDERKQYFDVRKVPDFTYVGGGRGFSPLRYTPKG